MKQVRKANQKIRTLNFKRSYLCNNFVAALRRVRSNPTIRTNKLSFGAVYTGEVGVADVQGLHLYP